MPAGCKRASIDCADFMGGCMVTKVPGLLRRRKERGDEPVHPQVIGYLSILLNATGLRKCPGIGYTRALQVRPVIHCGSRPSLSRRCGRTSGFELFIGFGIRRACDRSCNVSGFS